ncbi:MAG: hypothetical protein ACYDC0_16910 [Acidimicrobiales bacterium]
MTTEVLCPACEIGRFGIPGTMRRVLKGEIIVTVCRDCASLGVPVGGSRFEQPEMKEES